MLLDETCFFLAVDFDKSRWLEDSTEFMETCGNKDLSAALERSRSGARRPLVSRLEAQKTAPKAAQKIDEEYARLIKQNP